jgi:hypothetical protein
MLGAAVVALLVVGGAVAVFVATAMGYPDKYLLENREAPGGMSKARLSEDEMDEIGIGSNPGQIEDARLDEYPMGDERAEEAWMEVLTDGGGARVVIIAARFAEEEQAIDAAKQARAACSFRSGAVLRDGEVLVVVLPDSGASRAQARAVADALRDKARGLETVC